MSADTPPPSSPPPESPESTETAEGPEHTSAAAYRLSRLLPFLGWMRQLSPGDARSDLIAGLSGAVLVLPQGVAYALIAGLPPAHGLYAAIVVAIIAGLFGSSRHMVSGPAAAISMVVFGTVSTLAAPGSPEYLPLVLALTCMVGIIQLSLGLMRMGALVNLISHTVVIGFTAGAGVLIATSQLKHLFGIALGDASSFLGTWWALLGHLGDTSWATLITGLSTLLTAVLVRRLNRKLPWMLVAMAVGCGVAALLGGSAAGIPMVGALSGSLPPFSLPPLGFDTLRSLGGAAFALAVLGLIEAVSIARAIGVRSHQRIDGNQEFIGQGLSNLAGSFFSCFAGSGSFTRSGANYDAGARTPLSVVVAALIVLAVLLLVPDVTAWLPLPAMAGLIMVIAANLIEVAHIRQILAVSREEAVVLVITFLATLLLPLEFAIFAGVLVSLVLYLNRTSRPRLVEMAPDPEHPELGVRNAERYQLAQCREVVILRVDGSLFFGAVDHVQRKLARYTGKHVILLGTGCNFIDIAGAEMLEIEQRRLRDAGGSLSMCGFRMYALEVMERGGFLERMGRENYFHTAEAAIASLRDSVAEAHRAHGDQPAACPDCQLFGPAGIGPGQGVRLTPPLA
ncbi:SulP family inorganic anion transporter [Cobetia sp. UIB-001]|uniref:SulP family inorganic anion transporter n=1 Tax=Cobetia sp. UIB-001 TaxID=2717697 RepID=UPI0038513EEA